MEIDVGQTIIRPSLKWRVANAALPRTEAGDRSFHLLQFHVAHRRFPKQRMSFNDVLFHVKYSGLIDSGLRKFVSDKEYVKLYIAGVVGDRYNVPTTAILRSKAEVSWYNFPAGSIVKPTHASGRVMVVDDAGRVDVDEVSSWLDLDYYAATRERNYRGQQRKVIVEPLVFGQHDPLDYKFHCFRGRVQYVHVDFDRSVAHTRAFFTRDFERVPFSLCFPVSTKPLTAPRNFDEMVRVAERLSAPFDFVRVDVYSDGDEVRVGELTNVHGNAHEHFFPAAAEDEYGWRFFQSAPRDGRPRKLIRA